MIDYLKCCDFHSNEMSKWKTSAALSRSRDKYGKVPTQEQGKLKEN